MTGAAFRSTVAAGLDCNPTGQQLDGKVVIAGRVLILTSSFSRTSVPMKPRAPSPASAVQVDPGGLVSLRRGVDLLRIVDIFVTDCLYGLHCGKAIHQSNSTMCLVPQKNRSNSLRMVGKW